MATPASIAARRQAAIERIAKAIGFTPTAPKGRIEFQHSIVLEQIADHLDPGGAKPVPGDAGGFVESPFVPDAADEQNPKPQQEHSDERHDPDDSPSAGDSPAGDERRIQGRGRPPAKARGHA
jgi:hypothetical protein